MADFIDWSKLSSSVGSASYAGIADVLTTAGKASYMDAAKGDVSKYLQTGTDPYLQEAINQIVAQGKLSKQRSMADVQTGAQSRGLTGSSIESGDLAQTAANQEIAQQGNISNLLYQDSASKNKAMVNFLQTAYGIDFQNATNMANNLAQLMGQELTRQNDLTIANTTADAYKDTQNSWWENILPSVIGAGGSIGAALIKKGTGTGTD